MPALTASIVSRLRPSGASRTRAVWLALALAVAAPAPQAIAQAAAQPAASPATQPTVDPKTVVLQKTGYDGDPKKLADAIRTGVGTYLKSYVRQRQAIGLKGGMRQGAETGQNVVGYDPPFSPPPKVEPSCAPCVGNSKPSRRSDPKSLS